MTLNRSLLVRLMVPLVMALGAVGFQISAATAHDQLISSSPEAGENLAEFPDSVVLNFSGEPLDLGATVMVVGTDEVDYASDLVIDGASATAQLADAPADANYQIRWRIVSEDGHPLSGVINFSVGDAGNAEEFEAAPGGESGDDENGSTAAESSSSSNTGGGVPRTLIVALGGAAVALVVWVLIRRFLLKSEEREDTPS